ncbi:hypothetical protein GCM10009848_36520 [Micromonospora lupini]
MAASDDTERAARRICRLAHSGRRRAGPDRAVPGPAHARAARTVVVRAAREVVRQEGRQPPRLAAAEAIDEAK